MVYAPDQDQVVDLQACEDAYESERTGPGQLWIADRHFCTRAVLQRCEDAQAGFIVRQHARHPPIVREGDWQDGGQTATGRTREPAIVVDEGLQPWRRIELQLDTPTESGVWLWSNLPATIGAQQIADLYRRRWRIEGMLIALPVEHWPAWADDSACTLAQRLLALARHIKPSQVATSKRGPKVKKTKEWVDGVTARAYVSTACVIEASKSKRP